ncbi:hypothetical protein QEO94_03845 [Kingella negevensis]|uniref:hypothetical protein n=1 Tax=Kingella negevensis TaxID=1522312 RepID=UPI002542CD26|nr:hypothetical protein [Kingella negevensis]WII93938.1 hypothetical protein QEO94_03845 [Kingella negevensis]
MRSGKSKWHGIDFEARMNAMKDCLNIIKEKKIHIFAAVIERGYSSGQDTVTECFEQIASRFDMYLSRLHKNGQTHRGIAIFDKSSTGKSPFNYWHENLKTIGIHTANYAISQKSPYF